MSIAPLRLFHGAMPAVAGPIWTVPSDLTIVIKRIWIANPTGGSVAATLSAVGQTLLGGELVAANKHLNEPTEYTMAAGEVVAGQGNGLVLALMGFSI